MIVCRIVNTIFLYILKIKGVISGKLQFYYCWKDTLLTLRKQIRNLAVEQYRGFV